MLISWLSNIDVFASLTALHTDALWMRCRLETPFCKTVVVWVGLGSSYSLRFRKGLCLCQRVSRGGSAFGQSFWCKAITEWNNLPIDLKVCTDFHFFCWTSDCKLLLSFYDGFVIIKLLIVILLALHFDLQYDDNVIWYVFVLQYGFCILLCCLCVDLHKACRWKLANCYYLVQNLFLSLRSV